MNKNTSSHYVLLDEYEQSQRQSDQVDDNVAWREHFLYDVLGSIHDIAFALDRDLRHVALFGTWIEEQDLSPDMFLGRTAVEIMGPEADAIHLEPARRALKGGTVRYNWSSPQPHGRSTHYETTLSPMRSEDSGEIIGVLGIGRDVTEQHNTRQLLRVQRDLALRLGETHTLSQALEQIVTSVSPYVHIDCGGIYTIDYEHEQAILNSHHGVDDTFVKLIGRLPTQPPDTEIDILQPTAQYLDTHDLKQLRSALGHEKEYDEGLQSAALLPLRDEARTVALLVLASHTHSHLQEWERDFLETLGAQVRGVLLRTRTEEALRENERQYRTLVSALSEGIVFQDADGVILACNESAEEILGLTREQMMGRSSVDPRWRSVHEDGTAYPGEQHPAMVALRTGRTLTNEIMGVHKPDGSLTWISVNAHPLFMPQRETPYAVVASFTDITEERTATQMLRLNEERYRHMFETNQAIKFVVNPRNGRILEANQAAGRFYGYTREQLCRMTVNDIKVDDGRDGVTLMQKAVQKEKMHFYFKHRLASGEIRDVEIYSGPIQTPNGTFLYSIVHDVTPRKKAEEKLRQLSQAVEQSPISIVITDTDGRIEYVNPKFSEVTGYTAEEVLGRNPKILGSGHTTEAEYQQLWETIVDGREWRGEFQNRRKNGELFWENATIAPIFDQQGQITHYLGVKEDVTRKKQQQATLRRRNRELELLNNAGRALTTTLDQDRLLRIVLEETRRLLGVSACSIWLTDKDTGELECVQVTAPLDRQMHGLRLQPGQGLAGWVAHHGRSAMVANAKQDGRHYGGVDKKIGIAMHSILTVPLRTQHAVLGVFQLLDEEIGRFNSHDQKLAESLAAVAANALENARLHKDVQAQLEMLQQTQRQLIQSEKLAGIGELTAGVAHELNNPLSAVILYAQLLQHKNVSSELERDLDQISTQAQRAASIVRGLLDFARQRPPEQRATNINEVLTNTLNLLSYDLSTHNIHLDVQLENDLPLTMVDPHQLQQVFVNLINNAQQAMGETDHKNRLQITTAVTASGYPEQTSSDDKILIEIADNGPGIAEEDRNRIFDPFFTTKPVGQGTGLGLSVCHGIITEHQGRIWVEDRLEEDEEAGTRFVIELPIQTVTTAVPNDSLAQDEEEASTPAAETSAGKGRVLIIDDEMSVRRIIGRLLQRRGYQIHKVAGGAAALDFLADSSTLPDVILCDLRMPNMSGMAFYERLKEVRPSLTQRIIFTSGDTAGWDTQEFLGRINAPYLQKPFEMDALTAVVADVMAAQK